MGLASAITKSVGIRAIDQPAIVTLVSRGTGYSDAEKSKDMASSTAGERSHPRPCAPSYLNTELPDSKQEGEHLFSSLEGISQAKDAAPGSGEQLKVGNRNPTRPFPHV